MTLRSFGVQQSLEGGDELQIGGGGDIVVPLELVHEASGQLDGGGVESLAHVDAALPVLVRHLHVLQEAAGHRLQSVLGPRLDGQGDVIHSFDKKQKRRCAIVHWMRT